MKNPYENEENMPAVCEFCLHCEEQYIYEEDDYEDAGAWCNHFELGMIDEDLEEVFECDGFSLDESYLSEYRERLEELK